MLSKNIKFKPFLKIQNVNSLKKKILKFNKVKWLTEYPLLSSLTKKYENSYDSNLLKKYKRSKNFRIIGMGGSILGTEAIYQFLSKKIKKNFDFINNLKPQINFENNAINIIVSKSGETLETISNLNVLLKKNKNKKKNIFITENRDSYLKKIAEKMKDDVIEHKNYIGGRFSVLSEVGMLPAELMGMNINKFKRFNQLIKNKNFKKNLILNVDQTLKLVSSGKSNSIILNYDENSENLFKWYQQLIAESLGKKSKGIIPIISSMPKDNHSLLQLYLDGPKKNFYTFFNVKEKKSDLIKNKDVLNHKGYLKNKSLFEILECQRKATQKVFETKKIPFRVLEVINRSEEALGELFCFFMLETILLGNALKVNTFDQPSVELIKKQTKKFLI
tara:strand:+ start:1268 stop:2437 length:1170 start_codon:yes stop_codon:yes gene_type:complete